MYEGTLHQFFLTKLSFYKVFLLDVSMYLSYQEIIFIYTAKKSPNHMEV